MGSFQLSFQLLQIVLFFVFQKTNAQYQSYPPQPPGQQQSPGYLPGIHVNNRGTAGGTSCLDRLDQCLQYLNSDPFNQDWLRNKQIGPRVNPSNCHLYNSYRDCVSQTTSECSTSFTDQQYVRETLIKANNLTSSCPPMSPPYGTGSGYGQGRYYPNNGGYPSGSYPVGTYSSTQYPPGYYPPSGGSAYQPPINNGNYPRYPDTNSGSNRYPDSYPRYYPRDKNPDGSSRDDYSRGRFPGFGSGGRPGETINENLPGTNDGRYPDRNPEDRFYQDDNCLTQARLYSRTCDETLLQRQREIRNGRTAEDIQRRICCALIAYNDCLSKTVVLHCRRSSPTVVRILMGDKEKQKQESCRDFSPEQCSTASISKLSTAGALLITIALTLGSNIFF